MMIRRTTTSRPALSSRGSRRPLALAVSLAALAVATTGGAYAAVGASSHSISACEHHGSGTLYVSHTCARHDRKLTWSITGPRGPQGPQGQQGKAGAPGAAGATGAAGPAGVMLHVDSTTPFASKTLGTIGPWTITANCIVEGGQVNLLVHADGPGDSIADGSQIDSGAAVVSYQGPTMKIGDNVLETTGAGFNTVNLDLFSAAGGAHVSLFKYAVGPGNADGLRCKVSGTGYQAF